MKKPFILIFTALYSFFCLAQTDLAQLESFINATVSEVSDYFDFVDTTELVIDKEKSDLSIGKLSALAYVKTIALKSNGLSPLEMAVNANVNVDQNDKNNPNLLVSGEINGAIQVITLLNSIAETFGPCDLLPIDQNSTSDEHNQNILCMLMQAFGSAKSVPELLVPLQNIIDYAKSAFPSEDSDKKPGIISKILKSLKLEVIEGILLAKAELNLSETLNGKIEVSILNNSINAKLNGTAKLSPDQVEENIKLVQEIATNLMDKESNEYLAFEDNLYLVLGVLEAFLVTDEY